MPALYDNKREARRNLLIKIGCKEDIIEELTAYCDNVFDVSVIPAPPVFPMEDEAHVKEWRQYVSEAKDDPFGYIRERLHQLNIPVRQGISQTSEYAGAVQQGKYPSQEIFGGRLELKHPELFQMSIHESQAGALPVLSTHNRSDFELLVQALAYRNEPRAINPSVNAHMISGLINWDRVHKYELYWKKQHSQFTGETLWQLEMKRAAQFEKWRFYDRLIVIYSHPYSDVSASELGIGWDDQAWLEKSTTLRLEHEFTHYAILRLYGKMNVNLLDETICDWAGITCTMGKYKAEWFLRFLGLENWPKRRDNGRIHAYKGGLSSQSFDFLCRLAVDAASGLELLSRSYYQKEKRPCFMAALTLLNLELLACDGRETFFTDAYRETERLLEGQ